MKKMFILAFAMISYGCSLDPVYDPDSQFDVTCTPGYVQFYEMHNTNRDDFGPTNVGNPRPEMPQNVTNDCVDHYSN